MRNTVVRGRCKTYLEPVVTLPGHRPDSSNKVRGRSVTVKLIAAIYQNPFPTRVARLTYYLY